MELKNAIKRMDGLIQPAWCELFIRYIDSQKKENLLVGGGRSSKIDKDVRNVEGFSIGLETIQRIKNFKREEQINLASKVLYYYFINKQLKLATMNYFIMFKNILPLNLLQVDFLKYGENGKYTVHADQGDTSKSRQITTIINLNNDYEGGEFNFYNPCNNKDVIHTEKLGKGSIIMFPSNYLYPHSVEPITKGKRYSLVCWLG